MEGKRREEGSEMEREEERVRAKKGNKSGEIQERGRKRIRVIK